MKPTANTMATELRVKVELTQGKTFEPLITSFFENFNLENSLTISGSKADLILVFTEPPMEIIKVISTYESIEMSYHGQIPGDKTSQCNTITDSKMLSTAEETTDEDSKPTKHVRHTRASSIDSAINIPEIKNMAKEAESFDSFLLAIEVWLDIGRYQPLFESFALASTQVSKVSWVNLRADLQNKGIPFKDSSILYLRKRAAKKLKAYSVSLLSLLSAIAYYYKNSFFIDDSLSTKEEIASADESSSVEEPATIEENPSVEGLTPNEEITVEQVSSENFVVNMECMPEIEEFQEVLSNIDRTQSVEKQIQYVLNSMGLSKHPANVQNQILEIATIAVKEGITNWDSVFEKSIIPPEESNSVRLTFSSLINDYIKKYVKGHKVKIVRFLSDLQKVIMIDN